MPYPFSLAHGLYSSTIKKSRDNHHYSCLQLGKTACLAYSSRMSIANGTTLNYQSWNRNLTIRIIRAGCIIL